MTSFTAEEGTIAIETKNATISFDFDTKEARIFLKQISRGENTQYIMDSQNACVELVYQDGILTATSDNYNCQSGFLNVTVKIDISSISAQFANVDTWTTLD